MAKKVKKLKLKTHKATKKVLNKRQSGSITKQVAGNNHQTGGKSPAQKRKKRSKKDRKNDNKKRIKRSG